MGRRMGGRHAPAHHLAPRPAPGKDLRTYPEVDKDHRQPAVPADVLVPPWKHPLVKRIAAGDDATSAMAAFPPTQGSFRHDPMPFYESMSEATLVH